MFLGRLYGIDNSIDMLFHIILIARVCVCINMHLYRKITEGLLNFD